MKKISLIVTILCCCLIGYGQSSTTTTTTTTTNDQNAVSNDQKNTGNEDKTDNGTVSRFYFGGIALATFTSLKYNTNENGTVTTKAVLGYGIGGFLGVNLNRNIGLQGEVLYQSLSQRFKFGPMNEENKVTLRYVNVPVLFILNTGVDKPVNLNVAFGPQLGIKLGADVESSSGSSADTVTAIVKVKPVDIGFAYGAGIDFRISDALKFGLGFRGVIGLVDISTNSESPTTNNFYILDRSKLKTNSCYASLAFTF